MSSFQLQRKKDREEHLGRMVLSTTLTSKIAVGEQQQRGDDQPCREKKSAVTSCHPFETRAVNSPEHITLVRERAILASRERK